MFLTLAAAILLSFTTKYSLAADIPSQLNCTRTIRVDRKAPCSLRDEAIGKNEIVCFKADSGHVQLWYDREWRHGYKHSKLLSYGGCDENLRKMKKWKAMSRCFSFISNTNCLKVVNRELGDFFFLLCAVDYKGCLSNIRQRHLKWRPCSVQDTTKTPAKKKPSKNAKAQRSKANPTPPVVKRQLKGQHGLFKSPNYPQNYGTNQNYAYIITFPENKRIQLVFSHVDLAKPDSDGECTKDYIRIYDGIKTWSSKLYTFCGNGSEYVNKPIVSKNNELKITFVSDKENGNNKGFKATYGVYQEPIVTKVIKKKMTGVIIGTACGLFFFAITLLAICQSRRVTELYVQSEEQTLNGDSDVVQEKAPPSYDIVMASPEKYPVSLYPMNSKEDHWIEIPENEELPAYPGLPPTRKEPEDDVQEYNSEREMTEDNELTQDVETDEKLNGQDSDVCSITRDTSIWVVGLREESKLGIDARKGSFAGDESDEGGSDVGEDDMGESDVGEDDVGESDVGEDDVGEDDVGEGDIGEDDVGESDVGEDDVGRSDVGESVGGRDVREENGVEGCGVKIVETSGIRKESDLQKGSDIKRVFDTKIDVGFHELSMRTTNSV
ncbi:uncharacterized protein LOC114522899 [Dendronephthya gigantea]|uniref:uncharacterized protein LOC114522899 n=1 Tax=Dendronephthya gigantea TaxID=151771 RepID=UPI0010699860|nr:uncharacterized protein LOC114522899 [Dendronephthya gigantea]